MLSERFPDVTQRQIIGIFWTGVHQYVRLYLVEKGLSPKKSSLSRLVKYADRREKAFETQRREDGEFSGKVPGRTWGRFAKRDGDVEHWKPSRDQPKASSGTAHTSEHAGSTSRENQQSSKARPRPGSNPSTTPKNTRRAHEKTYSKEELDHMRANNLCFYCREPGHSSRNCPRRQTAKGPSALAGTVRFADIDHLVSQRNKAEGVPVSSVRIPLADRSNQPNGPSWTNLSPEDALVNVRDWLLRNHDPHEAIRAGVEPADRFEVYRCGEYEYAAMDMVAPYLSYGISLTDLDRGITAEEVREQALSPIRDAPFMHSLRDEIVSIVELDDPSAMAPSDRIHLESVPGGYVVADVFKGTACFLDYRLAHPHHQDIALTSRFSGLPWLLEVTDGHCRSLISAFQAVLDTRFPDGDVTTSVQPVQGGYMVCMPSLGHYVFITVDDAEATAYDAAALVDDLIWELQDAKENEARLERRRRRRIRLLTGAVRVPSHKSTKCPVKTADTGVEALERNASKTVDFRRMLPKLVVVEVRINGQPARALIDTGSMADFMSTTLVDQLRLRTDILAKPLPLQLAVHGSRSKVNRSTTVQFAYQDINGPRRFDVVNLDNYDVILGTPWIYQHRIVVGMNPIRVAVGSATALPMQGEEVTHISSAVAELVEDQLDPIRHMLQREAMDLCPDTAQTGLPPLRAVNHTIPLIDESRIYSWRPSKCPEALRPAWREKKDAYLRSGRWRVVSASNALPLLIIPKPPKKPGDPPRISTLR